MHAEVYMHYTLRGDARGSHVMPCEERGGGRVMRRTQSACVSEWNLLGATHNLLKP